MPLFVLDVDLIPGRRALSLRLSDEHGRHVGASQVRLDDHPAAVWEGLFDVRGYLRRFAGGLRLGREAGKNEKAEPATPGELLARLGVFLGQHVLGGVITGALAAGIAQRTLLVRLPDLGSDPLAAALARVPWELAWLSKNGAPEGGPLFRRNVVARAVPAGTPPSSGQLAVPLGADEALRVLLVHAHAPGSRPLAARLERERIAELFFAEVLPKRRVTVDWLGHGVTRERLRERVQSAGGYHIVHWSGHGRHDALELAGAGADGQDSLRGAELVELFGAAGGFIPSLVFLSACHSGSALGVRDWARLVSWLRDPGRADAGNAGDAGEGSAAGGEGFTGTALELVKAGVPQVVAMRFEVTDAFARELAVRFYRGLLGQQKLHAADAALAMARTDLAPAAEAGQRGYGAADLVTPLLFGAEPLRFEPAAKRSPQLDRARPRPQPLLKGGDRALDSPEGFVGREEELARISSALDAQEGPAAVVLHGAAGMGKSALAAEAIHLWHGRFDAVLAFHAKGAPLAIEEVYRQVDARLFVASPAYRARREANELAGVFIEAGAIPDGRERYEVVRENLLDVMLGTRILLVLDGFEESLGAVPGEAGYASADPAWDRLFEALVDRLSGSGSRVVVTSRRRIAALAGSRGAIEIEVGPLAPAVAALFLDTSEALRGVLFEAVGAEGGSDANANKNKNETAGSADGQELAYRVLRVSRGYPLVLRRLGEVAKQGREALSGELDRLAALGGGDLPDIFAGPGSDEDRRKEHLYFEAAAASLAAGSGAVI